MSVVNVVDVIARCAVTIIVEVDARRAIAIIMDVVARRAVAIIVEVIARRAVAIVVDVVVRGVVLVIDLHPHANPTPATQVSRAFVRMLGEGAQARRGGIHKIGPRGWPFPSGH